MTEIAAFALGLATGSFANVCIHRWPLGQSVVRPRSRCPRCGRGIAWFDKVPLLSYALLAGKCRACKGRIPVRYPLVEGLCGVVFALAATLLGTGPAAWKAAIFASMMLVLFFTDLERLVLPDEVTLGGLAVGIAFSPFVPLRPGAAQTGFALADIQVPPWAVSTAESAFGAALFGGLLLLIGEAFYRLRGVDGIGLGDVKLMAMIGAFHGASIGLLVLLAGSLLAAACGTAAVFAGRRGWRDRLPFGSYLSGTALAALFAGNAILNRYWEFVLE